MQQEPPSSNPKGFLPEKLQTALKEAAEDAKAAPHPKNLLPDNEVTRSDAQKSHLITQDYIVRLRVAGKVTTASSDAQMAAGGAIGLAVPAFDGAYMLYQNRPEMTLVQSLSLLFFGIAVAAYIVARRAERKEETVSEICSEIEQRKATKA